MKSTGKRIANVAVAAAFVLAGINSNFNTGLLGKFNRSVFASEAATDGKVSTGIADLGVSYSPVFAQGNTSNIIVKTKKDDLTCVMVAVQGINDNNGQKSFHLETAPRGTKITDSNDIALAGQVVDMANYDYWKVPVTISSSSDTKYYFAVNLQDDNDSKWMGKSELNVGSYGEPLVFSNTNLQDSDLNSLYSIDLVNKSNSIYNNSAGNDLGTANITMNPSASNGQSVYYKFSDTPLEPSLNVSSSDLANWSKSVADAGFSSYQTFNIAADNPNKYITALNVDDATGDVEGFDCEAINKKILDLTGLQNSNYVQNGQNYSNDPIELDGVTNGTTVSDFVKTLMGDSNQYVTSGTKAHVYDNDPDLNNNAQELSSTDAITGPYYAQVTDGVVSKKLHFGKLVPTELDLSGHLYPNAYECAVFNGLGYNVSTCQWYRDSVSDVNKISNATSSTYKITNDDINHKLICQATYTDKSGNSQLLTSAPSNTVTDGVVSSNYSDIDLKVMPQFDNTNNSVTVFVKSKKNDLENVNLCSSPSFSGTVVTKINDSNNTELLSAYPDADISQNDYWKIVENVNKINYGNNVYNFLIQAQDGDSTQYFGKNCSTSNDSYYDDLDSAEKAYSFAIATDSNNNSRIISQIPVTTAASQNLGESKVSLNETVDNATYNYYYNVSSYSGGTSFVSSLSTEDLNNWTPITNNDLIINKRGYISVLKTDKDNKVVEACFNYPIKRKLINITDDIKKYMNDNNEFDKLKYDTLFNTNKLISGVNNVNLDSNAWLCITDANGSILSNNTQIQTGNKITVADSVYSYSFPITHVVPNLIVTSDSYDFDLYNDGNTEITAYMGGDGVSNQTYTINKVNPDGTEEQVSANNSYLIKTTDAGCRLKVDAKYDDSSLGINQSKEYKSEYVTDKNITSTAADVQAKVTGLDSKTNTATVVVRTLKSDVNKVSIIAAYKDKYGNSQSLNSSNGTLIEDSEDPDLIAAFADKDLTKYDYFKVPVTLNSDNLNNKYVFGVRLQDYNISYFGNGNTIYSEDINYYNEKQYNLYSFNTISDADGVRLLKSVDVNTEEGQNLGESKITVNQAEGDTYKYILTAYSDKLGDVPSADIDFTKWMDIDVTKPLILSYTDKYFNIVEFDKDKKIVGFSSNILIPKLSLYGSTAMGDRLNVDFGGDGSYLSCQWYRLSDDGTKTAINGATNRYYYTTSSDVGKRISVVCSYKNYLGKNAQLERTSDYITDGAITDTLDDVKVKVLPSTSDNVKFIIRTKKKDVNYLGIDIHYQYQYYNERYQQARLYDAAKLTDSNDNNLLSAFSSPDLSNYDYWEVSADINNLNSQIENNYGFYIVLYDGGQTFYYSKTSADSYGYDMNAVYDNDGKLIFDPNKYYSFEVLNDKVISQVDNLELDRGTNLGEGILNVNDDGSGNSFAYKYKFSNSLQSLPATLDSSWQDVAVGKDLVVTNNNLNYVNVVKLNQNNNIVAGTLNTIMPRNLLNTVGVAKYLDADGNISGLKYGEISASDLRLMLLGKNNQNLLQGSYINISNTQNNIVEPGANVTVSNSVYSYNIPIINMAPGLKIQNQGSTSYSNGSASYNVGSTIAAEIHGDNFSNPTYEWVKTDNTGKEVVLSSGPSYTISSNDLGEKITCKAKYHDDKGASDSADKELTYTTDIITDGKLSSTVSDVNVSIPAAVDDNNNLNIIVRTLKADAGLAEIKFTGSNGQIQTFYGKRLDYQPGTTVSDDIYDYWEIPVNGMINQNGIYTFAVALEDGSATQLYTQNNYINNKTYLSPNEINDASVYSFGVIANNLAGQSLPKLKIYPFVSGIKVSEGNTLGETILNINNTSDGFKYKYSLSDELKSVPFTSVDLLTNWKDIDANINVALNEPYSYINIIKIDAAGNIVEQSDNISLMRNLLNADSFISQDGKFHGIKFGTTVKEFKDLLVGQGSINIADGTKILLYSADPSANPNQTSLDDSVLIDNDPYVKVTDAVYSKVYQIVDIQPGFVVYPNTVAGQTIEAYVGGDNKANVSYDWYRVDADGKETLIDSNKDINTYTLMPIDVGNNIKVVCTYDDNYNKIIGVKKEFISNVISDGVVNGDVSAEVNQKIDGTDTVNITLKTIKNDVSSAKIKLENSSTGAREYTAVKVDNQTVDSATYDYWNVSIDLDTTSATYNYTPEFFDGNDHVYLYANGTSKTQTTSPIKLSFSTKYDSKGLHVVPLLYGVTSTTGDNLGESKVSINNEFYEDGLKYMITDLPKGTQYKVDLSALKDFPKDGLTIDNVGYFQLFKVDEAGNVLKTISDIPVNRKLIDFNQLRDITGINCASFENVKPATTIVEFLNKVKGVNNSNIASNVNVNIFDGVNQVTEGNIQAGYIVDITDGVSNLNIPVVSIAESNITVADSNYCNYVISGNGIANIPFMETVENFKKNLNPGDDARVYVYDSTDDDLINETSKKYMEVGMKVEVVSRTAKKEYIVENLQSNNTSYNAINGPLQYKLPMGQDSYNVNLGLCPNLRGYMKNVPSNLSKKDFLDTIANTFNIANGATYDVYKNDGISKVSDDEKITSDMIVRVSGGDNYNIDYSISCKSFLYGLWENNRTDYNDSTDDIDLNIPVSELTYGIVKSYLKTNDLSYGPLTYKIYKPVNTVNGTQKEYLENDSDKIESGMKLDVLDKNQNILKTFTLHYVDMIKLNDFRLGQIDDSVNGKSINNIPAGLTLDQLVQNIVPNTISGSTGYNSADLDNLQINLQKDGVTLNRNSNTEPVVSGMKVFVTTDNQTSTEYDIGSVVNITVDDYQLPQYTNDPTKPVYWIAGKYANKTQDNVIRATVNAVQYNNAYQQYIIKGMIKDVLYPYVVFELFKKTSDGNLIPSGIVSVKDTYLGSYSNNIYAEFKIDDPTAEYTVKAFIVDDLSSDGLDDLFCQQ